MAETKARYRLRYPPKCPNCARRMQSFRKVSATVHEQHRERSDPAHYHLTYAGGCVGMHLHECGACGAKSKTHDPACNWRSPTPMQPGWGEVKASTCEHEDAQLVELPKLPATEKEQAD